MAEYVDKVKEVEYDVVETKVVENRKVEVEEVQRKVPVKKVVTKYEPFPVVVPKKKLVYVDEVQGGDALNSGG